MKELDLLKKDWKKNENSFEQVSENEIYKMLHAKSSSVVKWILIVSIIEFVILNGISFLIGDNGYSKFLDLHPFINFLEKFNYLVILVFIYLFYRNYKNISVLHSSKKLIEHILKTRKIVTYYIFWNIFIGGISGAIGGIEGFNRGFNGGNNRPENTIGVIEVNYITIIVMALLIMGGIWLFYKILYGGFLKKLKQNNEELKKIDL
ncbi:hypothetical protein [Flavobacterium cellulosilyticum]|uniref:Uncharacterized protein n=1 Tax=Flavobacterium cellulosilyticum TaxID=2541731 RepID=A0A4R5CDI9_9FLAO|nr:hypothetical protein [Flavobacterium cellulosilyticum]TDD96936.1 hypothetical protein E0F76_09840 [Flavobacterium cellulosilyticum]